ncbi:MAG TPA: shikimate dehydrogenase [Blastocatellia bacterium]|nr:shikimate dehydrogenase [Blastocatellia bacterium]
MLSTTPPVCISVCESDWPSVELAVRVAAKHDGLIEIRLDCLAPETSQNLHELPELLATCLRPTIITFRAAEEGGRSAADFETRLRFWREKGLDLPANFVDLELDIAEQLSRDAAAVDWSRVICSYHNQDEVPVDLTAIFERLAATPARVLKIAVRVDDAVECLPIFDLLERARRDGRELIAIGMGAAGVATRILGPARGAFLTYGSLRKERATAAGQLSIEELTNVYRVEKLTHETTITGLVGRPVAHSISPQIHNAAFARSGTNAVYIPFEVRDLKAFFRQMVHPRTREMDWRLRGLSITAPHKRDVLAELDWVEPSAREIGAVNTVVVEDDRLCGYNTDASAFISRLKNRFGSLQNARVAIIGAGGAASAALYMLNQENAQVTVFARNSRKAKQLADRWSTHYSELRDAAFAEFDVVINATPLGTKGLGEFETPAIAQQLRGARLAYDLVYNPQVTQFLREAQAADCETLAGLPMLLAQAAQQFELWTGEAANIEAMQTAALRALNNSSH